MLCSPQHVWTGEESNLTFPPITTCTQLALIKLTQLITLLASSTCVNRQISSHLPSNHQFLLTGESHRPTALSSCRRHMLLLPQYTRPYPCSCLSYSASIITTCPQEKATDLLLSAAAGIPQDSFLTEHLLNLAGEYKYKCEIQIQRHKYKYKYKYKYKCKYKYKYMAGESSDDLTVSYFLRVIALLEQFSCPDMVNKIKFKI